MTRWEYLRIVWESSTGAHEGEQTWASRYYVLRGSGSREALTEPLDWTDYLNELGLDGWELVAERMHNSAIFGTELGWYNVAGPVRMVFTFKRPRT